MSSHKRGLAAQGSCIAFGLVLWIAPSLAWATPQPLPFTYVYETLPQGDLEVEQYVDLTPVAVLASDGQTRRTILSTQFQTEFEYGITDRLELGLYATFVPTVSGVYEPPDMPEGDGVKERLRLRLGDEGQWPIDVALYGELVENDHEFEVEAKVILERRIGDLRIVANLWAEHEWEYAAPEQNWAINPTLGLTYQITPMFHPGVESWLRAEFPSPAPPSRTFNLGPQVYVGPTMMLNFGKLWWSTGLYFRTTDFGHSATRDDLLASPDSYGFVWARTVIGLSL